MTVVIGGNTGNAGSGTIPEWTALSDYIKDQPVTNGGHTYLATSAHVSGSSFAGDLAAHWTLLPMTAADVGLATVTSDIAALRTGSERAAAGMYGSGHIPATTRTMHLSLGGTRSDGVMTGGTARFLHTTLRAGQGFDVWVGNICDWGGTPAYPLITTAIRVKVYIEIGGASYPAYFEDGLLTTLQPGQIKRGRVAAPAYASGASAIERTYIEVDSGNRWPQWRAFTTAGDSNTYGAPGTDLANGVGALAGGLNAGFGFGVLAITDRPAMPTPFAVVEGDSIGCGQGNAGTNQYETGPFEMAWRPTMPVQNLCRSGERLVDYLGTVGASRTPWAVAGNVYAEEGGFNDIANGQSLATVQANMITIWRRRAIFGPVYQTTITPRTTSADGWTTTTQTAVSTATEAVRVAVNQWLRAGAPLNAATFAPVAIGTGGAIAAGGATHPLQRAIDICPAIETAQDSGIWIPTPRTADGIHPNAAGYTAVAALAAMAPALVIAEWQAYFLRS